MVLAQYRPPMGGSQAGGWRPPTHDPAARDHGPPPPPGRNFGAEPPSFAVEDTSDEAAQAPDVPQPGPPHPAANAPQMHVPPPVMPEEENQPENSADT